MKYPTRLLLVNLTTILIGVVAFVIGSWASPDNPMRHIGAFLAVLGILLGCSRVYAVLRCMGMARRIGGHSSSTKLYTVLPKVSGRPGAGAAVPTGPDHGTLSTATEPGVTRIELCARNGAVPEGSIIEIGMGDKAETRITGEPFIPPCRRSANAVIPFAAGMPPLRNRHSRGELVTIRARLAPVRPFEPDFDCISYQSPRAKEQAILKHVADRADEIAAEERPVFLSPLLDMAGAQEVADSLQSPSDAQFPLCDPIGSCPCCGEIAAHLLFEPQEVDGVGVIRRSCRSCTGSWRERLDPLTPVTDDGVRTEGLDSDDREGPPVQGDTR